MSKEYEIRSQEGHAHAKPRYLETGVQDYINLVQDFLAVQKRGFQTLNVHLPFEVQHPQVYPDLHKGLHFIRYGEGLKELFGIPLYWENSPELVDKEWHLKHGQTEWQHIPNDIRLTLDTGHAMLGARDEDDARNRIRMILDQWGDQISHAHVHENDLIHDDHWEIGRVITPDLLEEIVTGRTYIFEKV